MIDLVEQETKLLLRKSAEKPPSHSSGSKSHLVIPVDAFYPMIVAAVLLGRVSGPALSSSQTFVNREY